MVGVGVLNALINVVVLVIIALVDRAVELILRNLASNRLATHHRAPLVHDSDTWLPYLPRSVIKYYRHPAILLVVIFTILLVPAELVTELGIDVSSACSPRKETGPVISDGDATDNYTTVELGGMAFFLQSTNFTDAPFTRIQAGIPRTITGAECISCLKDKPSIISGCSVSLDRIVEAGQLSVSLQTTTGPFKTITSSFNETGPNGLSYNHRGDITRNGEHWASIVFHPKPNTPRDILYLEYTNQDHIDQLFNQAVEEQPRIVSSPTQSDVRMYSISCSTNKISAERFIDAVMVYRTIQLENPVRPARYEVENDRFLEITPESVYLSVLTLKIVDDDHDDAEFYRYTTCGMYNLIYLIPLCICVCMIILLGLISLYFRSSRNIRKHIPYSSRSWLSHVKRQRKRQVANSAVIEPQLSVDSLTNEMVLVEEGKGLFSAQTLVIQSAAKDSEQILQSQDHMSADLQPSVPYHMSYCPRPDAEKKPSR